MISPNLWQFSTPVPVLPRPPKPERAVAISPDLDRLRSALAAIPNEGEGLNYDTWRNCVFGIHHETGGSDEGLALVHEFSARSHKYNPDFLDTRVWPYVGVGSAEPITGATIYALARQHQWQDPATIDDFEVLTDTPLPTANPDRFQFVQAAEFSAGEPPGWIIKHVLPRAELVCLYGESGSGKSFMVLDILGAIACGEDWHGHRTAKGLTCGYIAAEGAGGVKNRLMAYAQHRGVDLSEMPLAVLAGAPNFLEADDVIALGKAMLAYGRIDVLVVDTLARVTAGANENSSEDMGRAIKHCETLHVVTGATIVLVHHSGKDASRGARGWSGIKGALDCELEVTRCDEDRVLTVSKMKDGQGEGAQFGFKLVDVPLGMDADGEVYGSCVVEYQERVRVGQKVGAKGKHEIEIHKIVLDLLDVGEEPSVGDVLTEYESRNPHDGIGRDTRRQVAQRALRSLVDKKVLVANGTRISLPEGEGE